MPIRGNIAFVSKNVLSAAGVQLALPQITDLMETKALTNVADASQDSLNPPGVRLAFAGVLTVADQAELLAVLGKLDAEWAIARLDLKAEVDERPAQHAA